jgi:hypothetical protein
VRRDELTQFPPPLLREWPLPMRIFLTVILPASFGFLCGALLSSSGTVFLILQIIGVAGGFTAGFEHDHWRGGVLRGLCGGAIFGGFILIGHAVTGGSDHGLLPGIQAFQILITVFFGVLLGWLGSRLRVRAVRRREGP